MCRLGFSHPRYFVPIAYFAQSVRSSRLLPGLITLVISLQACTANRSRVVGPPSSLGESTTDNTAETPEEHGKIEVGFSNENEAPKVLESWAHAVFDLCNANDSTGVSKKVVTAWDVIDSYPSEMRSTIRTKRAPVAKKYFEKVKRSVEESIEQCSAHWGRATYLRVEGGSSRTIGQWVSPNTPAWNDVLIVFAVGSKQFAIRIREIVEIQPHSLLISGRVSCVRYDDGPD